MRAEKARRWGWGSARYHTRECEEGCDSYTTRWAAALTVDGQLPACCCAQFQRLAFLAALPPALGLWLKALAFSFFDLAFSALLILLLACRHGGQRSERLGGSQHGRAYQQQPDCCNSTEIGSASQQPLWS